MDIVRWKKPKHKDAFLIYHIVNEQKRSGADSHKHMLIGKKLKRLGRLAGVPDYHVEWFDGEAMRYGYLEAKYGKGKLTPSQVEFKERCERWNIPYAVFYTPNEAVDILKEWGVF